MLFYTDPLQSVKDSDFVCELFDWDKYLSCIWKIGTYKRESNIDVAIVAETMWVTVQSCDFCNALVLAAPRLPGLCFTDSTNYIFR